MKSGFKRAATLAVALLLPHTGHAAKISEARVQLVGGFAIFELYDDPAKLPSCSGGNALAARARMEKEGRTYPYGTGCWTADMEGYIHLHIQGDDPGPPRETKLHNSKFRSVGAKTLQLPKKPDYAETRDTLTRLGSCAACADNIAQHVTKKPTGKCGRLATDALGGNAESALLLLEFPDYCVWKYQTTLTPKP